jgi:hypothetical protein
MVSQAASEAWDFYSPSFDLDVFVFSDGVVKLGAELGEEILHLMCLMYAGFKRIAPEQDTAMDLTEPWITALELFNAGE